MNPEERARVGFVTSMGDTRWAGKSELRLLARRGSLDDSVHSLCARVPRSEKPDHGPALPAHALIGGEYGFGFRPCQPGNHDLFADVERAQLFRLTQCGSLPCGLLLGSEPSSHTISG